MKPEIQCLQKELREQLQENENETNLIRRSEKAVSIVSAALQQLRRIVREQDTSDQNTVISLHKQSIPPMYAEYIYYASLHNLESNKPLGSRIKEYYLNEQKRIEAFFSTHAEFLQYYKSGKTHLDETYFIPQSIRLGMYIDLYSPIVEDAFCTPYSFHAAMGMAYERFQQYITEVLRNYHEPVYTDLDIQWTHSKTDLIELIYALHSSAAFNKGNATIRDITLFFEHVFGIQLGNTSMTFQEILRRKDSTAFIDRLKNKLELHITRIEEKKFD
ncbi:MAG: RteC domain-containing protein [Sediminibacterium sp.]|nr:RteC domain-containing protein [Sediminibacterium sp.]